MCHKFMAHPLFSFLRSFFHRISRMNRRHSCLSDYSRIFADIWPLANGWRPKYSLIVFVTQISQMTQIFLRGSFFVPQISQIYTDFLHHDFSSSDFTDESEGILACRITHGISRMWPVRSLQIPPEVGQSPTDSTDLHRYWTCSVFEKNTQISQMTQFFCLDIWGILLSIMARMNLCKSVESVGLLKRLTFSAFFNTLLPALFLPA